MRTLDRYVVRSFLLAALLWFLVLMSMRVVVDLFVNMDEFAEGGRPLEQVLVHIIRYYSAHSLVYFVELGGLILVAAAAFTLARMNHTNELTAILASGVSLYRVVVPILACSALLSGLVVVDREYLIPRIAPYLARSIDDLVEASSQRFQVRLVPDENRTVWYSRSFWPEPQEMENPTALVRDRRNTLQLVVSGEKAKWDVNHKRGWLIKRPSLVATEGWLNRQTGRRIYTDLPPEKLAESFSEGAAAVDAAYDMRVSAQRLEPATADAPAVLVRPRFDFVDPNGERIAIVFAETASYQPVGGEVRQASWQLRRGYGLVPSDLSPEDLILRQDSRWMELLSARELGDLLKSRRMPNLRQVRLARQIRFSEPVVNFMMPLLALPFILSRERNIKTSVGLCIGILAAFVGFVYACRYMNMSPVLAAWLPVMIFGPISLVTVDSVKT
ncbi:MAG: LptF/LptG family permease [Phycisphaerae bacterium]